MDRMKLLTLILCCGVLLFFGSIVREVQAKCRAGCRIALASYYVWGGSNLTYISNLFSQPIPTILQYNPLGMDQNSSHLEVSPGSRLNVPFSCDCINQDFLGHTFAYVTVPDDTYEKIAWFTFSNLTTENWLQRVNVYDPTRVPDYATINVTLNCSCGNRRISKEYGLFKTYPLRVGQNLMGIAEESGVPPSLLEMYNPGVNFSAGTGLVFLPAKGTSTGVITGVTIAGVIVTILAVVCLYMVFYRRNRAVESSLLLTTSEEIHMLHGREGSFGKCADACGSHGVTGIMVDKSVEFTYEELCKATNNFSEAHMIGSGGFGTVYYAELRGEKTAIKKMDMQASQEFLTEMKVLTHVHHLNLVRLIGYCVEGYLFLIYEYLENGSLSRHLRGKGMESLSWSSRVLIALDSARGLEYIHEHTVPVYIHRDIKSANILLDKDFRGKVADFGLSKLTEFGSASQNTRLVGTFGYMPPEYARYGDVSPKVDVYAFGVVLYELISGKEAVIKTHETFNEAKGLVALFCDILNRADSKEAIGKVIDPKLGDDFSMDDIFKVAMLAKACTQENPASRPSMRSIVAALMNLSSSSSEEWDVSSFYENQVLNLVPGR
ncbi:hypothetical protein MLD38_009971 [Melastoma candidum]|uniref:Uncharacterized protein n=1 Tax=Melastoma candidum TaxID=119954 RepID=A0ACB9R1W1_9MYRT|nr:hypothetical protein MLD38_009971 [Melastoma candidum]